MIVNYEKLISEIEHDVNQTHWQVVNTINREIVMLNWRIGRRILRNAAEKKNLEEIIESLNNDLLGMYPRGHLTFQAHNLQTMCDFARAYPDEEFVRNVFGLLGWEQITVLINETRNRNERNWYLHKLLENKWSAERLKQEIRKGGYQNEMHSKKIGFSVLEFEPTEEK